VEKFGFFGREREREREEVRKRKKKNEKKTFFFFTLSVRPRLLSSSMAGAVNASEFLVR
jgi:hypothetical protein